MITTMIDANNLATRVFFTGPVGAQYEKPDYHIMGYIIIDSIYRTMLKTKCTEVVLAVDSTDVWRKDIFPRYKEGRKKQRQTANVNWQAYYDELKALFDNIAKYLPFKVIKIDRTEADDIIGVLTLHYKNKGIVIISTDEDYKQLISKKVRLYQPLKRKWVECVNPETFLKVKILTGQKKDDIFNVLTPVDWPAGKKKPSFGEVKALDLIHGNKLDDWLVSEGVVDRYDLNRQLIDFRCIPDNIRNNIISAYGGYKLPRLDAAYEFFKMYDYKEYLSNYHRVEDNLSRLY